jgi:energy-coupling factor transport system substrate-specific component
MRRGALELRPRALAAIVAVTLVGIGAFIWPLLISFGSGATDHSADAPWIFIVMLPLLLLVVAAEIADGGMDAKAVAMLGVLSGIGAILRPLTGGVTGVQLMFFLLVPSGRVLGPGFGFVLGNTAMFASAALTGGGGPWLPFQMLAAGWVGLCAGLLPTRVRGRAELAMLALYGFIASVAYGFVLNLWFWPFGANNVGTNAAITFVPGDPLGANMRRWLAFSVSTGLGFDIPRGLATAAAVLLVGRPVLVALRRTARRASFDVPGEFTPAGPPTEFSPTTSDTAVLAATAPPETETTLANTRHHAAQT